MANILIQHSSSVIIFIRSGPKHFLMAHSFLICSASSLSSLPKALKYFLEFQLGINITRFIKHDISLESLLFLVDGVSQCELLCQTWHGLTRLPRVDYWLLPLARAGESAILRLHKISLSFLHNCKWKCSWTHWLSIYHLFYSVLLQNSSDFFRY